MRYGKIFTGFWASPNIADHSADAKLLAAYLLSSPHSNMIGCFRLPLAYAGEDLRMGVERVSEGFRNLSSTGFVTHDSALGWVLINRFLKWNPIENTNQGKAAAKLVSEVPCASSVYAPLVEILRSDPTNFPDGFVNGLATVSKPVTGTGTVTVAVSEAEAATATETISPAAKNECSSTRSKEISKTKRRANVISQDEIEEIYRTYPRKAGRGDALKAIKNAIKRIMAGSLAQPAMEYEAAVEFLMIRTARFANSPAGQPTTGVDYRPYPATWFNGEHYFDSSDEWQKPNGGNQNGQNFKNRDKIANAVESASRVIAGIDSLPDRHSPGRNVLLPAG